MKLLLALATIALLVPLGIILTGIAFRAVEELFEKKNAKPKKTNKTKGKA